MKMQRRDEESHSFEAKVSDDALVCILSNVGIALKIAQFATVNRRWRNLRWFVTRIMFCTTSQDASALRYTEDMIFSVLYGMNKNAPGCLRELVVDLNKSQGGAAEACAHWLMIVSGTIQRLELCAYDGIRWGPSAWRAIACCDKLLELKLLGGNVYTRTRRPLPKVDFSPLRGLVHCELASRESISVDVFQDLLAVCTVLENLILSGNLTSPDNNILTSSSNLKYLSIITYLRISSVALTTPALIELSSTGVSTIKVLNASSLQQLQLCDTYKIQG